MPALPTIGKDWTLFLDRDGVINHEKHNDYVLNYTEFSFYDGVLNAMRRFADNFGHIILVTNQRGVEKGLMTEADLHAVHDQMTTDLEAAGGRIDGIYFATSLLDDHPDRKPQIGMARRAQTKFPGINFTKSIMVGNNLSDMQFGRSAGMQTVFLTTTNPDQALPHPLIDFRYNSLLNFADDLLKS